VSVAEVEAASNYFDVASVQNMYNVASRGSEEVLTFCEANGIAFMSWFPIGRGSLAASDGPLRSLAAEFGATPSQLCLSWLLHRSPVNFPIPGTTSIEHLKENLGATAVELDAAKMAAIEAAVPITDMASAPPE